MERGATGAQDTIQSSGTGVDDNGDHGVAFHCVTRLNRLSTRISSRPKQSLARIAEM
jgi:hypothetical protein